MEERARRLMEKLRAAAEARPPDPLRSVDFEVEPCVARHMVDGSVGPDVILRARYHSGGSEASNYAIQREARLWADDGRLVRARLQDTDGAPARDVDAREVGGEEPLWEQVKAYMEEIL